MRRAILLLVFAIALILPARAGSSVPAARLERLTRGINLSHWLAQTRFSPERIHSYVTADDARLIHQMGFRHVRLTFNCAWLFDEQNPAHLDPDRLALLDGAIRIMREAGLAVIVDLHPESDFKKRLTAEPGFVDKLATWWRAVAAHLAATTDPDWVFMEAMNECEVEDAAEWQAIQGQLLAAMRAGAPRATLIASGSRWSGVPELLKLRPYPDPDIVYNFHYYEPGTFTHQGATWAYKPWAALRGVPYPSDPANIAAAAADQPTTEGRAVLRGNFGKETWNSDRIDRDLAMAADWATSYSVPLTCNEFGVYKTYSPRDARLRWIHDVRADLERHGIGWAMWDYADSFGVATGQPGQRRPDEGVAAALGLESAALDAPTPAASQSAP